MSEPVRVGEEVQIKLKFYEGPALIHVSAYQQDRSKMAIFLCTPNYEPLVVATVYQPQAVLAKDEVLIKTWSENEGVSEELQRLGILTECRRSLTLAYETHDIHIGIYGVSEAVLKAKEHFDKKFSELVRAVHPNNHKH